MKAFPATHNSPTRGLATQIPSPRHLRELAHFTPLRGDVSDIAGVPDNESHMKHHGNVHEGTLKTITIFEVLKPMPFLLPIVSNNLVLPEANVN